MNPPMGMRLLVGLSWTIVLFDVSRDNAIYSLHYCWSQFEHHGDVPRKVERIKVIDRLNKEAGHTPSGHLTAGHLPSGHPTAGDEIKSVGELALPSDMLHLAKKWLIDTGSGNDLVCKKSVSTAQLPSITMASGGIMFNTEWPG